MKEVCDSIFRLYAYSDSCKRIHYTCQKNHFHELADDIRDSIIKFADEMAEQFFGYNGKPSLSDIQVKQDIKINDSLDGICNDVLNIVEPLRKQFDKNPKLSGIVSLIDDFKGEINKFKFLATFDKVSNA